MISQKFSIIPEDQIMSFMNVDEYQMDDSLLDSIESVSDLWTLAKMKESYNEDKEIHNSLIDNNYIVFSSCGCEDTSGCCHRPG